MQDKSLKPGSPFLFTIIRFLNIAFGISALALIALAIWLWRQFNHFSIVEIVFIGLGVVEFLLVCLIFTAKTSVIRLRCYLFFMMILFVAELTAVIVVFATGDSIINDIAKDSQKQIAELKKYLNVVTYYCIGSLAIMLFQMAFTYCYIGSLRNRNDEFGYKFVDEDGNKMSLQEKTRQDQVAIQEKTSKKREDMMQKYQSYRNYKESGN